MKKNEKRLISFLTNPELSDSDFREIAMLVTSRDIRRYLDFAWSLRRQLDSGGYPDEHSPSFEDEVYRKVSQILLEQARLRKGKAIQFLLRELDYNRKIPARSSFRRVIAMLLEGIDG